MAGDIAIDVFGNWGFVCSMKMWSVKYENVMIEI